jgi:hypothetical protein
MTNRFNNRKFNTLVLIDQPTFQQNQRKGSGESSVGNTGGLSVGGSVDVSLQQRESTQIFFNQLAIFNKI